MPVSQTQTRVLREHFGDVAAPEIVAVLNDVEASNVTELRTQNELNFARFETLLTHRFAEANANVERRFAEYDAKLAERFLAHTRWMLGAWTTIFLAVIGLWFRH